MDFSTVRAIRRYALLVFFVVMVGGVLLQPGRGDRVASGPATVAEAPAAAQG